MATAYSYPATLKPDVDGRVVVRFPALPEALTDGADTAEALREAADCLSEALASRIDDGEQIPSPGSPSSGQYLISPSPTIALKAALYEALRRRDMTVADLAARLDMDWHQAARLIDPRRASKLTSLSTALRSLDCEICLFVHDPKEGKQSLEARAKDFVYNQHNLAGVERNEEPAPSLSDATLRAVQAHREGATTQELLDYLSQEFGMAVRANQLGIALQRHLRRGQLENRNQRWYWRSAKVNIAGLLRGARAKRG